MGTPKAVPGENVALTYRRLRGLIGWIGLSLPLLLFADGVVDGHVEQSISEYYYTNMTVVFTGTMCVIGIFLLAYRFGDMAFENVVTTLSGVAALGVAFFHCAPPSGATLAQLRLADVHLGCAAVLFVLLGVISVVVFPSDVPADRRWQARLYRALGGIIWAAIVLMVVLDHTIPALYNRGHVFFWLEALCVIAFSLSFILKGRLGTRLWRTAPGQHARLVGAGA